MSLVRRLRDILCGAPLRPASAGRDAVAAPDVGVPHDELVEIRRHSRNLVELNPQIVFITDAQGQLAEIAETWLHWAGLSREDAQGLGWTRALHPDDLDPTLNTWRRSIRTGEPMDTEYRLRKASGSYIWFRARAVPQRDDLGNIVRWYGAAENIHERKSIDDALRASEAFSRSILKSSHDAIMVIDHEGNLEFVNDRGQAALKVATLGEVKGKPWIDLWPDPARDIARQALAEAADGQSTRFETFRIDSESLRTWWDVSVSKIQAREIEETKVLAIARDVTEAKIAQEKLERAAYTDSLTGLANRAAFRKALASALERDETAAILSIDLDQFKAVNDILGHLPGDELLRQAALRLCECVGGTGLVARIGGDEFGVVLGGASLETASGIAARIVESLGAPYRVAGRSITVSACVGAARLDEGSVDDVLKRADIALYSAKLSQSGSARIFEEAMGRAFDERLALMMDLRHALSRGEFAIEYQGLVRSGRPGFSCFEALLRWQHPVRGRVSPGVFIPLLEETGGIASVGLWVLDEACREATAWPAATAVAVNLSTLQFRTGELVAQVARSLERSGLAPNRLQLEITESVLLKNSEDNLQALRELRAMGVRIVLDDFGTGYSSLSYLRRFAFDKIKIDRSFVEDILSDGSTAAVVSTVVGLAERLGVPTTAEGVETEAQHRRLVQLGCTEFQGYLFSRPMPPEMLAA